MKSEHMRDEIMRDVSASFWLRDAIKHLDGLNSRDPVDAFFDLQTLQRYTTALLSDKRNHLNAKLGIEDR
jgi:hypothetical protein